MDDEVRRLERLAAHDPTQRPALRLALRRAGLPARDVAGILDEARALEAELARAREAWLAELARGWPALLDALLREEPGLNVLVVTAWIEEQHDRPWVYRVQVVVDPDELVGLGVSEAEAANLLAQAGRGRIVDAALAFAPLFAREDWWHAGRLIVRRTGDGGFTTEVREVERWADGMTSPQTREALDGTDRVDDELRAILLEAAGVCEVPLVERHGELREPPAPPASVAELVARAREATAARDAARDAALDRLAEAFDRFAPAVLDERPYLPGFAVHGHTPMFLDGDLCEHTQWVLTGRDELLEAADELAQRRLPELGLSSLVERAPGSHVQQLRDELAVFAPALERRHGYCWVLVVERGEDGAVATRVGEGYRPY